jgi:uncharacterized protein (DUF433 family)
MVDALLEAYTGAMTDEQADLIVTDPDVVHGQARVRGTRIPVSVVLDCLAAGLSEDDILGQYPTLTIEGVRAAAAYAPRSRVKMSTRCPREGQTRREPAARSGHGGPSRRS